MHSKVLLKSSGFDKFGAISTANKIQQEHAKLQELLVGDNTGYKNDVDAADFHTKKINKLLSHS